MYTPIPNGMGVLLFVLLRPVGGPFGVLNKNVLNLKYLFSVIALAF